HALEPAFLRPEKTGLGSGRGSLPLAIDRSAYAYRWAILVIGRLASPALPALGDVCGVPQPHDRPAEPAVRRTCLSQKSDIPHGRTPPPRARWSLCRSTASIASARRLDHRSH